MINAVAVRLRNGTGAPLRIVQEDAPDGMRVIEPEEEFETDSHTAAVLMKVTRGVIELPPAAAVQSGPQLILPTTRRVRDMR